MFRVTYLTKDAGYRLAVEDFIRQMADPSDHIVAHTSGSTGLPKDIRLLKRDMEVSALATNRRFGINNNSRLLCPLSANYIAGKMMIARAMAADCEVAFCKPSNNFWSTPEVASYLNDGIVDLVPVVPSQCGALPDLGGDTLNSHPARRIRNIIIGGAAIPQTTEMALSKAALGETAVFATYGMTETCSHVALRSIGDNMFHAMPGISFSADERDCLKITAGDYSFRELQTNDIATVIAADRFIWRGRYDNVINSGGIKLFPEELEKKLEDVLPGRFYIKGTPDPKWGEAVTLVVERHKDNSHLSDGDIISICHECLSPLEMPKRIEWIAEISLTPNGKLKRI